MRHPVAFRGRGRVWALLGLFLLLIGCDAWAQAGPAGPRPQVGQVSGRVADVEGAPVPDAVITVLAGNGRRWVVRANSEGQFSLDAVPWGTHDLVVTAPGFADVRMSVSVEHSAGGLDLVLQPGPHAEHVTVFGARLTPSEAARRQWPGAVDVLAADVLESAHVFSTSEALRKVPGITVRDEEGIGLRPNIAVRGLNPTRSTKVLLLEDGIASTYAPYGDNASYYHPPIDRFERIEVMKGASQIAHGPVTVGAVINYITPEPPHRPSLALGLAGGSRRFVDGSLTVGGTWRATGVLVDVMRKQSDGARANVFSQLDDVNVKATRQLAPLHGLSMKLNRYREESQVTYSGLRSEEYDADPRSNPFRNDRFDGDRMGGAISYRGVVGSRVLLTTTGYAAAFRRDWWRQSSHSGQRPNDRADPACGGMANLLTTCGNEGRLRRYHSGGVEGRAHVSLASGRVRHELDTGVRFHVERQERRQLNGNTPTAREGVLVEDNRRTTDAWSGFLLHQVRVGNLALTPGIRVERVAYGRLNRLRPVAGRTNLVEVLPGIGVSVARSERLTVFAGLHRGFAPPRAEDVIDNATGAVVDLEPERGWNYEAGVRTRLAGVDVDATGFRLDYENQIVPASVAGGLGATLTNGGQTLHQGVELGATADTDSSRRRAHAAYVRAAVTWLPIASFRGVRFSGVPGFASVSVAGNRVPYAPAASATTTVGYRSRHVDAQVEAQFVGHQFGDDLNTVPASADGQRGRLPDYTYWNGAVTWRLPRGGSAFVTVKNLRDSTFIVDRTRGVVPGVPRLIHVGTNWRF